MSVLFSIIIVNYNSNKLLFNCLESLNNINYKECDYEVVVVDNCSEDSYIEELENKKDEYNYKLVKNSSNEGFGAANNLGVKKSKGKYIFLVNPDTYLQDKNIFEKIIKDFENDENIGIVGTKVLNRDGSIQSMGNRYPNIRNLFLEKVFFLNSNFMNKIFVDKKVEGLKKTGWVPGCFMGIKRDDYNEADGFDENIFLYSEDIDLCLKINELNKKIMVDLDVSIYHLRGGITEKKSSMKNFDRIDEEINTLYYVLKKHGITENKILIKIMFYLNYSLNNIKEFIKKLFLKLAGEKNENTY